MGGILRAGGVASVAGGLLWALEGVLGESFPAAMIFIAPLLLATGLAGFYFEQRPRLKGLGQSGFTQSVAGLTLLAAGFFGAYTLGDESLLRVASFGFLITAFGLVLTGYACIKEGVLAREAGVPLRLDWLPLALGAVAPLGLLFGGIEPLRLVLALLFGAGWIVLGLATIVMNREE